MIPVVACDCLLLAESCDVVLLGGACGAADSSSPESFETVSVFAGIDSADVAGVVTIGMCSIQSLISVIVGSFF
jgi:hypothetical protein